MAIGTDSKTPSKSLFTTLSGVPIDALYTAESLERPGVERDLSRPGEFPYTRGIHPDMYRGKLWTMRQFAGFGTAEDTNERFKYLLARGQTGLSVAFDYPTLMGLDSDSPLSLGEVGRCGVAMDSLADMEALFDGIALEQVTTSMTTNAPASILLAMYVAVAEQQGADLRKISGTIQNDILKEYIAQMTWIFPPRPAMRLITDVLGYCTEHLPRWNTISISGYHIREAGSTALQELAFTLRDGIEYVQAGIDAGLDVDSFAPRLSFFFDVHNDFFEEIAKFRAARRIWARVMKQRFGAKDERSLKLRTHAQTAGVALTSQQPFNNVVRVTYQALAAVLGGTQSLHTCSLDETLALPTESAVTLALRTQQIIAHETGVINTVDPLGGSYFLEALTDRMEQGAMDYFEKIDAMGGMIAAIEQGFPQREIHESAYRYQQQLDRKEKVIVGVNEFVQENEEPLTILKIDESAEERQVVKLKKLRRERPNPEKALKELQTAALGTDNLMPYILACVRQYATLGEICDVLREVFGLYQEPSF